MNSDFKDLLAALCKHRVRFLVVGGYAVMFHTAPRFTKDLDLWLAPSPENAGRFRDAMVEFGAWKDHMRVENFCAEKVMFQIGLPPTRVDKEEGRRAPDRRTIGFYGTYRSRVSPPVARRI